MFDNTNNELLQSLKGNISWIHSDTGLGNYLRVIARVDDQLVGLTFAQQNYSESSHSHRYRYKDIVVGELPRRQVLSMVAFQEIQQDVILLTRNERKEWHEICEQDKLEKEKRESEQEKRKEKQEKAEYERLREKYGN